MVLFHTITNGPDSSTTGYAMLDFKSGIKNFAILKPYFSQRTIKPVYMKLPSITENTEDSFIREYIKSSINFPKW